MVVCIHSMILSDVVIGDTLFQDEDWPVLGNKCLVKIGSKHYVVGILHSYTVDEYCFKECVFYHECEGKIVPWIHHPYRPIHWTDRHTSVWTKHTKIESSPQE